MSVTTCPHCNEGIDTLTRTGKRKYSCGECNMVIAYDDIEPHLDEMEVIDKRNSGGANNANSGSNSNNSGNQGIPQQAPQIDMSSPDMGGGSSGLSEREKIYQRGPDGLKEIKKNRLKQWLAETEGVGAQTENRITMVFDRNDSVHKNPHVLYNLLDDEVGASASYLNTMVQDIFSPEEEHSDLLTSQGYTPWHNRANGNMGMQNNMGRGGPMNATGMSNFSPGQQGQQQNQPPNQQQNQQQAQQGGPGNQPLSREEAEVMMRQAMTEAGQQQERNALLSGLSEGADEAVKNMASNVGGLAGTMQRVIDEALVQYARENPEWVIENMDILQKVLGATKDVSDNKEENVSEEDAKVDDALNAINNQQPNQQFNQQHSNTQSNNQGISGYEQQQSQQRHNKQNNSNNTHNETNPDIDDSMMEESGFNPEFQDEQSNPDQTGVNDETHTPEENNEEHTEGSEHDPSTAQSEDEESFDSIFGDITEE